MQTEDVTYGIGKLRNCIKSGKHMMEFASMSCGIRTNLPSSLQLVGMEKLNIGTNKLLGTLIFKTVFYRRAFLYFKSNCVHNKSFILIVRFHFFIYVVAIDDVDC